MKKIDKSLITVFLLTVISFIIIILGILLDFIIGSLFLPSIFIFFFLGALLLYLTLKQKIKGSLKKYLLLTGISVISFPISTVLHNLFYALAEYFQDILIVKIIAEVIHVIFFLVSVPISPIAFIIGIIGTIIVLKKKK